MGKDFIYPVSRYLRITQIYHSQHLGVDFGWHDMDPSFVHQPIVAIEDGVVVYTCDGYGNTYPKSRVYGNCVIVDHKNGFWSVYAHLMKGTIAVKNGQAVKKGQQLAQMNNSGYSCGTHLHFELRKGWNLKKYSIDPMPYLAVEDKSLYVNPSSKWYDRIKYRETAPIQPVERNTRMLQMQVNIDNLRCRTSPSYKSDSNICGYVPRGYYNVSDHVSADGYDYYKIGDNRWAAVVMGVHLLQPEKPHIYCVTFPEVSNGDKETLEQIAEKLELKIVIDEKETA